MTGERQFGAESLRRAVQTRVDDSSLRGVAAEIGMSWSGLRSFLEGGKPQVATLRRITTWYLHARKTDIASVLADVEAAVALLASYIADAPGRSQRDRIQMIAKLAVESLGEVNAKKSRAELLKAIEGLE